jgi:hypothetical protein
MRNAILSGLAEDTIGPLNGLKEIMTTQEGEFPINQYFIGILSPRSIDDDSLLSGNDDTLDPVGGEKAKSPTGQGDFTDKGVATSAGDGNTPKINASRSPNNMGMSFTCIHSDNPLPDFEFVITYARYKHSKKGNIHQWARQPRSIHISSNEVYKLLNAKGNSVRGQFMLECPNPQDGALSTSMNSMGEAAVWVHIRPSLDGSETIVTLMLINNLRNPDLKTFQVEYNELLVHQPEIRVNFVLNTHFPLPPIEPVMDGEVSSELFEEAYDEYRYRTRAQRGRGHLCSVTWGDFDPQQFDAQQKQDLLVQFLDAKQGGTQTKDLSECPPFYWVDSQHSNLSPTVVSRFSAADIRTEYLPMIVLPAPDMDPKSGYWVDCPTAETISEAYTPTMIENELSPLVDGYEAWVKGELSSAPQSVNDEAMAALQRMQKGIDLLKRDDVARYAFNIANRAIHQSNKWNNSSWTFRWRKFQLAFALASIESLSDPSSPDRSSLDLLWVATGGGKTEAYLLLMAYAIVHRRLLSVQGGTGSEEQWHGVDVITRYTLRLLTIQQSRRTLGTVTALEWLRNTGWHSDPEIMEQRKPFSTQPVTLGLWVGSSLTPNKLGKVGGQFKKNDTPRSSDGLRLLKWGNTLGDSQLSQFSEPAQILSCPACQSSLSYPSGQRSLSNIERVHWVCFAKDIMDSEIISISANEQGVSSATIDHHNGSIITLSLQFDGSVSRESDLDRIWNNIKQAVFTKRGVMKEKFFRPGRPGYFPKTHISNNKKETIIDFEIHCPVPSCDLNQLPWQGRMPSGVHDGYLHKNDQSIYGSDGWRENSTGSILRGMPIPAFTVDEQIYAKCPSIIIATVDKFAQIPREAGGVGHLFGNVGSHHQYDG